MIFPALLLLPTWLEVLSHNGGLREKLFNMFYLQLPLFNDLKWPSLGKWAWMWWSRKEKLEREPTRNICCVTHTDAELKKEWGEVWHMTQGGVEHPSVNTGLGAFDQIYGWGLDFIQHKTKQPKWINDWNCTLTKYFIVLYFMLYLNTPAINSKSNLGKKVGMKFWQAWLLLPPNHDPDQLREWIVHSHVFKWLSCSPQAANDTWRKLCYEYPGNLWMAL